MVTVTNESQWRPRRRTAGGILVWDVPVRLFHWLLAASVATAAATGFLSPEWWLNIHLWAGYAVGFLIVFRVVWGFLGSSYARFTSFLFSIQETLGHLRALFRRSPAHYPGHNPAGALMVFALLVVLGALAISGLAVLGGQENQGMLAGLVTFRIGDAAGEAHKLLAILLLFMIAAHVLGVLSESLLARENLVRAMVTGRKTQAASGAYVSLKPPSTFRALFLFAAIAFVGGAISWALARIPASGLVPMPQNATYAKECGDCHHAYHPSLLPGSSWRRIMVGLTDHFGEDASLDKPAAQDIAAYLTTYASERWDTEAANNLRRISTRNPLSITASRYWTQRHEGIAKPVFALKSIGSEGNCIACHKDAGTGRFADQMISIPGNQTP